MIAQLQLEHAHQADHERRLRIMQAWRAYEGDLPKPLKVEPGEVDDNIRLPLGQVVVNKGVSFLFPEGISFEVDGAAASEANTWLTQCWEANRLMTTLLQTGINGAVCGDVFLKIKPGKPFPRVIVLDPADVTVHTEEDDYQQVLAYVLQWNTVSRTTGKPIVRRQVIEHESPDAPRWSVSDYEQNGANWILLQETTWHYPWAPIVHCQNLPCPNAFHGYSDLEPSVLHVNNALNFVVSNTGRIIRFHAHPLTVATGVGPGDLVTKIGQMLKLANVQATVKNLEMESDLGSSLTFARDLKSFFHEISRIPEVATGKVEDLGQLSGLALQILYQPLLEKTRDKRVLYGEMLRTLNRRLLELGGKGKDHVVKTHWPPVLPSDPKGDAETALLHSQLGVSDDTLQTRLGFDPEDEKKKKAEERKNAGAVGADLLRQFDRGRGSANPDDEPEDGTE